MTLVLEIAAGVAIAIYGPAILMGMLGHEISPPMRMTGPLTPTARKRHWLTLAAIVLGAGVMLALRGR